MHQVCFHLVVPWFHLQSFCTVQHDLICTIKSMQNQLTAVPVWGAAVHVQTDMTGLVSYWRRRDDSLAGSGAVRSFYLCRRWISGCLFVMDADMRDAACCRCTHHDTPSVSSFSKREKSCDASSVFEAKEIFRGGSFLRNATDVFIIIRPWSCWSVLNFVNPCF